MRIGAFETDFVFQSAFVLPQVTSGRARLLRAVRIRNTRGTAGDWMTVCAEINGRRTRLKAVRNLSVGDEDAARHLEDGILETLTVPPDCGPGVYAARLLADYDDYGEQEEEIPFTFRVLPGRFIPTDFARAPLLSAYVRSSPDLRGFMAGTLGSGDHRTPGQALRDVYGALLRRELVYHPVPLSGERDCQETADPALVLKRGGSCADLSLLFASLLWCWGIPPALLLFPDHMAAGCFDPEDVPAFEMLEGAGQALDLLASGRLRALDCVGVCTHLRAGAEEAERLLVSRLEKDPPCVTVNVRQALRGGVVPAESDPPPYRACPRCGFDRFGDAAPGRLRCPGCGLEFDPEERMPKPVPVPGVYSQAFRFGLTQGGAAVVKLLGGHEEIPRVPPAWQGHTVRRIGDRALEGSGIRGLILPEGLTHIGDYAFHRCADLRGLTLPEGLTVMGTGAFSASGLERISVPRGVRRVPRMAFSRCASLEQVELRDGLQYIDERAFAGCPRLRQVFIPHTVLRVARDAFDPGCQLLTASGRTVIS